MILQSNSYQNLVDFCWGAIVTLNNIREDIEGADGRIGYLVGLRVILLRTLSEMDDILSNRIPGDRDLHGCAKALEYGIPFLGLTAQDIATQLGLKNTPDDYENFYTRLTSLVERAQTSVPGNIPNTLSTNAQRELLRLMQTWSKTAELVDEDLSFLVRRFSEF